MSDLTSKCINAAINCEVANTNGPQMIFDQKPSNPTPSQTATFVFHPNEATYGAYTCTLDANPGVDCSSGMFQATNLPNGGHTLVIKATDLLGNVGTTTYSWMVDVALPVLTLKGGFPSGWSNVTTAAFTLTASEPVSYTCQLDGGAVTSCTNQPSYTGLAAGSHTFTAWGTDGVGSKSAAVSQTWIEDLVKPVLSVTGAPPALTNSQNGSLSLSSNEANSTFKCSRDGTPFAACTSPYTWSGLWDGSHSVSAYAIDPAGNVSTTWSVSWTVDTAKPVVTITSHPANPTNLTSATFTFTASDLHGVSLTCQLDLGSASPCTTPKPYSGLKVGSHTFTLVGTDGAGNSTTRVYTWTINQRVFGAITSPMSALLNAFLVVARQALGAS
jgi:hypothetical protein